MSSDFWVITSYFNPARYKTKRLNFDAFMAGMKAVGANVLVVEMAFGDASEAGVIASSGRTVAQPANFIGYPPAMDRS